MHNFEQIGLIPRSIIRTFKRFIKQISSKTNLFAIYEFRVSRYLALASIQCFFFLIIFPWIFQILIKFFIFNFLVKSDISFFDNFSTSQQEQTVLQADKFEEQLYFETLLESLETSENRRHIQVQYVDFKETGMIVKYTNTNFADDYITFHELDFPFLDMVAKKDLNEAMIDKAIAMKDLEHSDINNEISYDSYLVKCAYLAYKQNISVFTNCIADLMTLLLFLLLFFRLKPQIIILKTFFIESLLNLNEVTKCFLIIFFLDLLVGFHSSKSWEVFLKFVIEHFGLQFFYNPTFIAFFISTIPVLLDTMFKYWIFRYLNRISPSTVAIYQAMIE